MEFSGFGLTVYVCDDKEQPQPWYSMNNFTWEIKQLPRPQWWDPLANNLIIRTEDGGKPVTFHVGKQFSFRLSCIQPKTTLVGTTKPFTTTEDDKEADMDLEFDFSQASEEATSNSNNSNKEHKMDPWMGTLVLKKQSQGQRELVHLVLYPPTDVVSVKLAAGKKKTESTPTEVLLAAGKKKTESSAIEPPKTKRRRVELQASSRNEDVTS
jgi:hypothetical protein